MMLTAKDIKESIGESESLKVVATAYSELAGARLIAIRANIERNRVFVSELASVFHLVREAAERQKISLETQKEGNINLVITSNHHFYGGLETRLMQFFVAHSALSYGQSIVIGKSGQEYLRGVNFTQPYESVIFAQDVPTEQELRELVHRLAPHSHIFIYHSKMQSVLVQRPVVAEVGGIADIDVASPTIGPNGPSYIFEPEIKQMIDFFDQQITGVLIEQAFLESELARAAARLVSMEDAQRNASNTIKSQKKLLAQVKRSAANAKILEMVLSVVNLRATEDKMD